ncbi:Probable ubiquitin-conjugating enzyme E2 17, partial [Ancistrocladus abbreviatus]
QQPEDNDRRVRNCKNGRSPKEASWWFHDDKSRSRSYFCLASVFPQEISSLQLSNVSE